MSSPPPTVLRRMLVPEASGWLEQVDEPSFQDFHPRLEHGKRPRTLSQNTLLERRIVGFTRVRLLPVWKSLYLDMISAAEPGSRKSHHSSPIFLRFR